ncbi:MAG: hypothetical protein ACYTBX_20075 [Planctomycetota bacterium]
MALARHANGGLVRHRLNYAAEPHLRQNIKSALETQACWLLFEGFSAGMVKKRTSPLLAEGVYMLDRTDVELMFNNSRRCKNLKNSQNLQLKLSRFRGKFVFLGSFPCRSWFTVNNEGWDINVRYMGKIDKKKTVINVHQLA